MLNGGRKHTIRATPETPNANLYFIKSIGLLCLLCMRFGHERQLFGFSKGVLLYFSRFFFIYFWILAKKNYLNLAKDYLLI